MSAPSRNPKVREVQDRTSPEDQRFAGVILLTAALKDVADELKVINRRLERLMDQAEVREKTTWTITRRR